MCGSAVIPIKAEHRSTIDVRQGAIRSGWTSSHATPSRPAGRESHALSDQRRHLREPTPNHRPPEVPEDSYEKGTLGDSANVPNRRFNHSNLAFDEGRLLVLCRLLKGPA